MKMSVLQIAFLSIKNPKNRFGIWDFILLGVLTICSYSKGGTLTTKIDLKNECLINHKTVCEERNPAFWIGVVIGCFFLTYCIIWE